MAKCTLGCTASNLKYERRNQVRKGARTKWGLFRKPIRANKGNVTSYALAAVDLYTYLQQTKNASNFLHDFVDTGNNGDFRSCEWRKVLFDDAGCLKSFGKEGGMREELKDYLNSDEGSLHWQQGYVQRNGRVSDEPVNNEEISRVTS